MKILNIFDQECGWCGDEIPKGLECYVVEEEVVCEMCYEDETI